MASRSEIRAVKNSRCDRESYPEDPYETYPVLRTIPSGPHAPNSNEAHALRRLMAQTGLTEAQLREHKCYRVQLSEAQKSKGSKTPLQRRALRVRKNVTRELQLPKEHPQVKEAFLVQWLTRARFWGYSGAMLTPHQVWEEVKAL